MPDAVTQKSFSVRSLCSRFRSQLFGHRENIWFLFGDSDETGHLAVNYAGRENNKEYLKEALFGPACPEKAGGRVWKSALKRMIDPETSFMVTEYHEEAEALMKDSKAGFFIPFWLGWVADIPEDVEKLVRSTRSLIHNRKKVRENHLTYEVVDNPEEFESFYDTMYLPYIGERYDLTAHFMNRDVMRLQSDHCELLYVKKGDEYLSGVLIRYDPEYPTMWSIGVKDARPEYVHDGAVGALYYFIMHHLKEKGHSQVSFGATRSFLSDGVLSYKRKWPLRNVGFSRQGFHLQPVSKSPEAIGMLERCPFIFVENGALNSAVFIGPDTVPGQKDIEKFYKSSFLNGLNKVVLYVFGHPLKLVEDAVPASHKDSFIVRKADELFIF